MHEVGHRTGQIGHVHGGHLQAHIRRLVPVPTEEGDVLPNPPPVPRDVTYSIVGERQLSQTQPTWTVWLFRKPAISSSSGL